MFGWCANDQQRLVRSVDQKVVDDHAHLHAALGGAKQRLRSQDPGVVGAPDEILHLNRSLRVFGQPSTRQQCLLAGVST